MYGNRVSVYEAAEILGVTVETIRKRTQRGKILYKRDCNGGCACCAEDVRGMSPATEEALNYSSVEGRTLQRARKKHRCSIRGGMGWTAS